MSNAQGSSPDGKKPRWGKDLEKGTPGPTTVKTTSTGNLSDTDMDLISPADSASQGI